MTSPMLQAEENGTERTQARSEIRVMDVGSATGNTLRALLDAGVQQVGLPRLPRLVCRVCRGVLCCVVRWRMLHVSVALLLC